eukprot:6205362-Pleurochrysis_carterae.AAC.2
MKLTCAVLSDSTTFLKSSILLGRDSDFDLARSSIPGASATTPRCAPAPPSHHRTASANAACGTRISQFRDSPGV